MSAASVSSLSSVWMCRLVAREAAMWELEERHLQEKHQQLKQQLKDQYFLQRHQLLKRHEKVSVAKRAVSSDNGTSLNPQTCVRAWVLVGDGADAALQPAAGGGDEEQADPGEGASAQDSAQRGQDPHGHVQEEPPNQRRGHHHPRAGARAREAGRPYGLAWSTESSLLLASVPQSKERTHRAPSSPWMHNCGFNK